MLKELALRHKNVAFLCHSMSDFIEFVNIATNEMTFSKTTFGFTFYEDKEYILEHYIKHLDEYGAYALIVYDENEFQFYSRRYSESEMYIDWSMFEILNFSQMLRKIKLEKINA